MDAFEFRGEQVRRILEIAEAVGGEDILFRELLYRMSNDELKDFADDMMQLFGDYLVNDEEWVQ
jgi:hypothetical protein